MFGHLDLKSSQVIGGSLSLVVEILVFFTIYISVVVKASVTYACS